MATLDCESFATALRSIAEIYDLPDHDVVQFLSNIDIDQICNDNNFDHTADVQLRIEFEAYFDRLPATLEKVYWFHLTRCPEEIGFSDGILPLNEALPAVWDRLFCVFRGTEHEKALLRLSKQPTVNWRYNQKLGTHWLWGPFAMLVRDSAFCPDDMRNHDYLRIPEIVEDILDGYEEETGVRLHEEVERAFVPTIVKFSSQRNEAWLIEPALYYLYCKAHGLALSGNASVCYDGGAVAVPADQIVKVEKDPTRGRQ